MKLAAIALFILSIAIGYVAAEIYVLETAGRKCAAAAYTQNCDKTQHLATAQEK